MNPNTNTPATFEFPPAPNGQTQAGPEQAAARPEAAHNLGAPAAVPPPIQPMAVPQPTAQPQTAQGPQGQAAPYQPPLTADDSDLIEKAWIEKAKQIVASTRSDPFNQNRELNKVKADYLQKRYNKTIKIDES